jgi:hypothetical protein
VLSIGLAGLVNADDIPVLKMSGGFRFASEPQHLLLARELPGQQHFQRNRPIQADLSSPIDNPHSAATDFLKQFVIPKANRAGRVRVFSRGN